MTEAEIAAIVLQGLVDSLADDLLLGTNSGVEDVYSAYVKSLTVEEGSY
jgi:hypothetical protein